MKVTSEDLPEYSIFVIGDNRDNGQDRRYWDNKIFIKLDKVIGKVLYRCMSKQEVIIMRTIAIKVNIQFLFLILG